MKKLTLIVHANLKQDLADTLRALPQVGGFSLVDIEGHSALTSGDAFLSERDRVVGFVPRVRADILLQETDVPAALAAIRGVHGADGVYWVTDVEGGRL